VDKIFPLTLLAASFALPMAATAATQVYSFNLDGLQEVPANASPAAGSAQFTVDDSLDTITFVLTAFNLQGTFSAAHIHGPAMAGVNAGVVFGLTGANADYAGPVMAGPIAIGNSYMLYGANKAAGPSLADQINAQPSMYYVNLHTSAFPGGEIRGQLAPVPEASTYAMMLGGLGLVGFMAARRRRSV
jgi:hypothetical protein